MNDDDNDEKGSELERWDLEDGRMPSDLSQDTRRMVRAISRVQAIEQEVALIESVEQAEEWRVQCSMLASWAQGRANAWAEPHKDMDEPGEWVKLGNELWGWAIRVGMMCQRRTGQLLAQFVNQGGRPKKTGAERAPVSEAPPKPSLASLGLDKHYAADAKLLASVSKEKLVEKMEAQIAAKGKIKKGELIAQLRAEQKAPEQKEQPVREPEGPEEPAGRKERPLERFMRYWTKEKKLLRASFETKDLAVVADYWWREFHVLRAKEEKILAESRQESRRRKGAADLIRE